MDKVSVIIPARDCPFLKPTVEDIFAKAKGDIEVIVMLDGCWPDPSLKTHKNLVLVHTGTVKGMRTNINAAARIAKGKYIMKSDDHCMFGEGFDEILKADCKPGWLAIPSRYSLDPEKWERTRGPVDYLTLTYPFVDDDLYGKGFHGKKWRGERGITGGYWHPEKTRKDILIDDIITFQGSSWFMHKDKFLDIEGFDDKKYTFFQEAQELGFKVWLSGGRVVRNKKTWYAHLHKGKKYGSSFGLSKKGKYRDEDISVDFWMNNRWHKQTRNFKWLIDKFWPIDGWPKDWESQCA
jgi:glycosyltransferase involved in cell wall biosynthesis